jgi:anti-sigma regulatory factor (Ser/Thr protein kinase)
MVANPQESQAQPGPASGQERYLAGEAPSLEQAFDGGTLYQLRSAVAAHASASGLSPSRVYDVVTCAHELAANAVRHGAGHGRLRLDCDGVTLYCQVSDDGMGTRDDKQRAKPGGAPSWPVQHGHGLWVIGKVADQFTIEHGPARTTATAAFTLCPPGWGRA